MSLRFVVSFYVLLSMSCCKSTAAEKSGELLGADEKAQKIMVQGYDLSGLQTLDAPRKDMICTTVLRPEEAACQAARGKTIWADKCKPLCSLPIAPKGKVAGYNFSSFVIAEALAPDMVCAAVVSAEEEACFERGGKTQVAAKCKHLCSLPIASEGKISGFNFNGAKLNVAPLPKGTMCTQVVRPEEEACRKAGGKILMAEKCEAICTVIINK